MVKGMNPRSQGLPCNLAHEKTCSLCDKKSLGGCRPTGNKLLCLALGGLGLREWGEKQCGGFRDRARLDP